MRECVPCEVRRGHDWEACGCAETLLGGSAKGDVSVSVTAQFLMNIDFK